MVNFEQAKKLAALPVRTLSLCLAGELLDEVAQLEKQYAEAKPPTNLGEASPRRLISEQIEAKREQMREATVDFKLRALPARKWSLLWLSMPTRLDADTPEEWDAKLFPFYASLVSRTCAEPEMDVEQVGELCDLLHGTAWNELVSACLAVNMGEVNIPNSAAASDLTGTSEQT